MDDLWKVIVLGVVEGITEFLPVSSTGHLLLCERWMGIDLDADPFWKLFTVFIQIGAIFAVLVYFRQRIAALLRGRRGGAGPGRVSPLWLVLIATIPVLVLGKLAHHWVEDHLESPSRVVIAVAAALGIGGVIMLLIEWFRPRPRTMRMEEISLGQGLLVGICQCLAVLFPGTSRSAATILPGMAVGLCGEAAAEFSFFLAIPAMFAAAGYSLLKGWTHLDGRQAMLLAIGTLVSFLVAWIVIAAFMRFIRTRSFIPFALYRILLAGLIIALLWKRH